MSFDKLKGKMTEVHISQAKLSEHLGITVQSLNAKLNGRNQFTLEEVVKITEFLNHLFYCDNYWFSDSLFLDSAISFWIVSTDSFNVSSCSDVVALEAFVLSKISESI